MNAIKYLIKEHDKVRTMLSDISHDSHRAETKRKLFDELSQELIRHEKMEQTVWYPLLKKNKALTDLISHLISEEKSATRALNAIEKITSQRDWEEKFSEFRSDVEHHAKEEETKLFPQVENILSQSELEKIGKEMLEFKHDF